GEKVLRGGGGLASAGNNIAANGPFGISLTAFANGAVIQTNRIGTNAAGTAAVGTQQVGVRVLGTNCTIGSNTAVYRNVISGNTVAGLSFENTASGCTVQGNFIGLDATGSTAIANGLGISLGSFNHVIGGGGGGQLNVISGNSSGGVAVTGTGNEVQGNLIGLNAAGTAAVGNGT